jgi:NCAIR mutase (PurE)-related protein
MLVWHVIDVVLLIHLTHKMGFPGVGFQESKKKKKVIDVVSLILLSKRITTVLGGVSPFSYADVLIF